MTRDPSGARLQHDALLTAVENIQSKYNFRKLTMNNKKGILKRKANEEPDDPKCSRKIVENAGEFYRGNHESEICYGGEADIHKHFTDCKKNPGHKSFKPVKTLSINHLPLPYRYREFIEIIRLIGGLTVQVKTKYISPARPEFYPGTNDPYPFYNNRGCKLLRLGTGFVYQVIKYTEKEGLGPCSCTIKCLNNTDKSKVWFKIHVLTARHVVFDGQEVKYVSCVFGFDDEKSPTVSLDTWDIKDTDTRRDRCWMTSVTCNLKLGDELVSMCKQFKSSRSVVEDRCKQLNKVDKLTIIVSHPHGCPKQMSIGEWTEKTRRQGLTSYTYNTCTCPGSSGAFVYRPGDEGLWPHCHSGSRGTSSSGNINLNCEWYE